MYINEYYVNEAKKILSESDRTKAVCIIVLDGVADDFVGQVLEIRQDRLYLIDEVRVGGVKACIPDYHFMVVDRARWKIKRYVESDRQMDSAITFDGKTYTCHEVEAMYSDTKEKISKLISRLKKMLADAGIGEDEAVYMICGPRAFDYLFVHYCRENLSEEALLHDDRIYEWPEFTLINWRNGMEYDNEKEPKETCDCLEIQDIIGDFDVRQWGDGWSQSQFLEKEHDKESPAWTTLKKGRDIDDLDHPLKVGHWMKFQMIEIPKPLKSCDSIQVKFWGRTSADHHLLMRKKPTAYTEEPVIYDFPLTGIKIGKRIKETE